MAEVKKDRKNKKKNKSALKKFVFIPIVIILVVAISYLGKYIYNRYLEFEKNNQVEIYKEENNDEVEIYIYQ